MRKCSLLVYFLFQATVNMAQPVFNDLAFFQQMDRIYAGQMGRTKIHLGTAQEVSNLHYAWWQLLQNRDVAQQESFIFSQYQKYREQKMQPDSIDAQALFIHASAALFAIRVEALKGNNINSAKKYLKALPLLKELLRRHHESDELKLLAGLYHFGMPEFTKKHKLLLPLFWAFPDADVGLGKRLLLECLESSSPFVRTETRYFLFKFYKDLFENPDLAKIHLSYLSKQYPENYVFKREWALLNGD
jgi:hypothetical protein